MAMSLNELTKSLRQEQYAPRSEQQLQSEAEERYTQVYDAMRNAANQRQQAVDDAYERELQSLAQTLETGNQALSDAAARGNAAIDDYINSRSMQRTSYGAASKGSTMQRMTQAAAAMRRQQETAAGGIENSRILLAQQLAGTLAQYDKDFLSDVQAYIDAQKQLDYDRKVASDAAYNDLQMAIYEYGKARSGGSGGGRRYGSSSGNAGSSKKTTGDLWSALAGINVAGMSSEDRKIVNTVTKEIGNQYVSPYGKERY